MEELFKQYLIKYLDDHPEDDKKFQDFLQKVFDSSEFKTNKNFIISFDKFRNLV